MNATEPRPRGAGAEHLAQRGTTPRVDAVWRAELEAAAHAAASASAAPTSAPAPRFKEKELRHVMYAAYARALPYWPGSTFTKKSGIFGPQTWAPRSPAADVALRRHAKEVATFWAEQVATHAYEATDFAYSSKSQRAVMERVRRAAAERWHAEDDVLSEVTRGFIESEVFDTLVYSSTALAASDDVTFVEREGEDLDTLSEHAEQRRREALACLPWETDDAEGGQA